MQLQGRKGAGAVRHVTLCLFHETQYPPAPSDLGRVVPLRQSPSKCQQSSTFCTRCLEFSRSPCIPEPVYLSVIKAQQVVGVTSPSAAFMQSAVCSVQSGGQAGGQADMQRSQADDTTCNIWMVSEWPLQLPTAGRPCQQLTRGGWHCQPKSAV